MEGTGGSMVFYTNWLTFHSNKEKIYGALFTELQPSILHLHNVWESPTAFQNVKKNVLAVDEELAAEAHGRLRHGSSS